MTDLIPVSIPLTLLFHLYTTYSQHDASIGGDDSPSRHSSYVSYVGSLFFLPPFFAGRLSSSSPLRFDGLLGGIVMYGRWFDGGNSCEGKVEIVRDDVSALGFNGLNSHILFPSMLACKRDWEHKWIAHCFQIHFAKASATATQSFIRVGRGWDRLEMIFRILESRSLLSSKDHCRRL